MFFFNSTETIEKRPQKLWTCRNHWNPFNRLSSGFPLTPPWFPLVFHCVPLIFVRNFMEFHWFSCKNHWFLAHFHWFLVIFNDFHWCIGIFNENPWNSLKILPKINETQTKTAGTNAGPTGSHWEAGGIAYNTMEITQITQFCEFDMFTTFGVCFGTIKKKHNYRVSPSYSEPYMRQTTWLPTLFLQRIFNVNPYKNANLPT